MKQQIIECVPNISEGKDLKKINTIANVVTEVEGIKLLDIDPGKATNRTVITFVGEPSKRRASKVWSYRCLSFNSYCKYFYGGNG